MGALTTGGSLFDDLFRGLPGGYYLRPLHGDPLPAPGSIKIDVKETAEGYSVQAELPGVDKNDIQISVERDLVTLSAQIKQRDQQSRDEKLLREERYYGSVSRSFRLPCAVDEDKVQARYEHGVLHLNLPKKEAAAGRRIRID